MAHPTWLVTGGAGFLGANLGRHLQGQAHRIAHARAAGSADLYDEWIAGDLADPSDVDTLARLIVKQRPDVVIHAAAMATHEGCEADPDRARRVNADASAAIARAAGDAGSRFILISTDAVFDGTRGNYAERDAPNPFSTYGRTKLEGEQRAATENPDALIVRTNFFGWSPSGSRSILEFFVTNLREGRQVKGFTDFTVTSAYVGVLCDALVELAQSDADGILHVTSPDALTKYEFGVAVAEEFGLDAGLITPTAADVDPPRNRDLSLDVSRAQSLLATPLITQREAMRKAREGRDLGG
jgi:dTDP-4-dehydrorhamnose reductase